MILYNKYKVLRIIYFIHLKFKFDYQNNNSCLFFNRNIFKENNHNIEQLNRIKNKNKTKKDYKTGVYN